MGRTSDKKTKVAVCLVSTHPLFLSQFQEKLESLGVRLQAARLASVEKNEPLPRASVYVVDSFTHQRLTEDLVAGILSQDPAATIIVMAESFSEETAFPLLQLGVKGILRYSEAEAQLVRALQAVSAGGYWVPRAVLGRLLERIVSEDHSHRALRFHASISRREREILDSLLENLSNKEIASKLNISERTVKFHVSNLLAKYGVRRRADLILLSFQSEPAPADKVQ